MWPGTIVRQLFDILPAGYVAVPTVSIGRGFGADTPIVIPSVPATAASPEPTLTLEVDFAEPDEYEVRVYDTERDRLLVAAIEIVSPSNKDRPDSRGAFVGKVAALLQKDVCVSIVDLVSIRQFNLYAELLELLGGTDPHLASPPPHLYAVTIRTRKRPKNGSLLDVWHYPMAIGQPLPTLPIWLTADLRVLLPLEPGYEETCRLLHIA
jgi:hypothetical protein